MAEEFSHRDIKKNLKFASDTARPLETSFWKEEGLKKNQPFKNYAEWRDYRDSEHGSATDVLGDIEKVGPGKPLGYLAEDLIKKFGKILDLAISEAEAKGLTCYIYNNGYENLLYVYDRKSLADFLEGYEEKIEALGWPTAPEEFVQAVATRYAEDHQIYEIVGKAFNDPRWKPGVKYY